MPFPLLLSFQVDSLRFALPAREVVEVARAVALTPLPGAPPVVPGLIDYRGTVVPVFDLARRFTGRERPVKSTDGLIVTDSGTRRVALLVDAIEGLVEPVDEPTPPPTAVHEGVPVRGVVRTADGVLLVHDLTGFLTELEAWTLDGALYELARGGER